MLLRTQDWVEEVVLVPEDIACGHSNQLQGRLELAQKVHLEALQRKHSGLVQLPEGVHWLTPWLRAHGLLARAAGPSSSVPVHVSYRQEPGCWACRMVA